MHAANKISLEETGQMLSFILLSCTHQKHLLDRWPFLRLPPGSWQIDTLFLLFIGVCVWSRMRPLVLIQKCFSRLAACILLKHQSNLNSYNDVCRALPLVDCVHSAQCCILNYSTTLSDVLYTQVPCSPHPFHTLQDAAIWFIYGRCFCNCWEQAKSQSKHVVEAKLIESDRNGVIEAAQAS